MYLFLLLFRHIWFHIPISDATMLSPNRHRDQVHRIYVRYSGSDGMQSTRTRHSRRISPYFAYNCIRKRAKKYSSQTCDDVSAAFFLAIFPIQFPLQRYKLYTHTHIPSANYMANLTNIAPEMRSKYCSGKNEIEAKVSAIFNTRRKYSSECRARKMHCNRCPMWMSSTLSLSSRLLH